LETYTDHLEELSADNETFAVNITAARLLVNPDPPAVSKFHILKDFVYIIQICSTPCLMAILLKGTTSSMKAMNRHAPSSTTSFMMHCSSLRNPGGMQSG